MTFTQLPDRQRGFPPNISKPVHDGEPCLQGHESFRGNMMGSEFVISPSTMIKATFSRFMAALDNLFNIYRRQSGIGFQPVFKRSEGPCDLARPS